MKTNYALRWASHPRDAKQYDTSRLRSEHLIETLFTDDEVTMVYSMYDRLIVGGAFPVSERLQLEAIDPIKAPVFLHRRELGVYNVGAGPGVVYVGTQAIELNYKEALYLGAGDREVFFASTDAARPAKFYFCSAVAHRTFPDRKITKGEAIVIELGALETSNHRRIHKMLTREVLETCQLQMGMTELRPGSVWNTMPAHVHSRRMEAYFYFDLLAGQSICHFMGEPQETRLIWMQNEQAVLSPEWSIHSAAGTAHYTFIWGMAGENLDYSDQDICKITDLK